ncbi:MAG: hypothetical protein ACFFE2_16660 [Candidatus Thorarchaeota archaeon]
MIQGRPVGVILIALLLIVAFCADFYNGISMIIGPIPIPTVYATLGTFYGVLLVFGGFVGLSLFYGILNLRNWARLIFLVGFPAQVTFNLILDPAVSENYFLLALSFIMSGYLLLPRTRIHFSPEVFS